MTTRPCDVETMADFYRYYSNSWVGYNVSDSTHVLPCLVGPLARGGEIHLKPLEKRDKGFVMSAYMVVEWDTLKKNLEFGRPDIGMIDDGPTILFASYSTPRSPHKGFRTRELSVDMFNNWDIRAQYKSGYVGGDRHEWLWHVFNPEYKSFKESYEELLAGKRVGTSLSRTLGIYIKPDSPNPLLAYKRWTLGYVVSPKMIRISPMYEDYGAEITRQTGAEVSIA